MGGERTRIERSLESIAAVTPLGLIPLDGPGRYYCVLWGKMVSAQLVSLFREVKRIFFLKIYLKLASRQFPPLPSKSS